MHTAELRLPPLELDDRSARKIAALVAKALLENATPNKVDDEGVERIISPKEAAKRLGVHRVTLDKMERRGDLPRRRTVSAGSRTVGWLASEFESWLRALPEAVGGQPPMSVGKK